MKSLSYFIKRMNDTRRKQGTRYPFDPFIMMIILANMSGFYGQNEIFRFMDHNRVFFSRVFNLPHGVPAITRVKTFLRYLDYEELQRVFDQWSVQFVKQGTQNWASIDGKCLASTVTNSNDHRQNYIAVVSLFSHQLGISLKSGTFENKKGNEIEVVQELIEAIEIKGFVLTLDALHCQKKRSKPSWSQEMSMLFK